MFKSTLVAVALTVSFAISAATPAATTPSDPSIVAPRPVQGCCLIYFNGRWICMPCVAGAA